MIIYEGIAGVVLFLAMSVLAIYFYGRLCRDAGYEEGRADKHEEQLAEDRAERTARAGRHRASQPRASAPSAWFTRSTDPRPGRVQLPTGGAIGVFLGKPAVTGTDTVLLPPEPAPQLTGAADTGTMTRIHLETATTGAIRAVGDELVAKIERGELV
jgi:Na+-transporting methylmalonyl-CoA/oxaloacetate decarboxylase gamma subunit